MARRVARPKLVLGKDYVFDDMGRCVLTRDYLLSLGSCCGNHCRYCPYGNEPTPTDTSPRPTTVNATNNDDD